MANAGFPGWKDTLSSGYTLPSPAAERGKYPGSPVRGSLGQEGRTAGGRRPTELQNIQCPWVEISNLLDAQEYQDACERAGWRPNERTFSILAIKVVDPASIFNGRRL